MCQALPFYLSVLSIFIREKYKAQPTHREPPGLAGRENAFLCEKPLLIHLSSETLFGQAEFTAIWRDVSILIRGWGQLSIDVCFMTASSQRDDGA